MRATGIGDRKAQACLDIAQALPRTWAWGAGAARRS